MTQPRVIFPAENRRFDYGAAKEFGDPVFAMTGRHVSPFKTEELTEVFKKYLETIKYDPRVDYIALTGNVVNLVMLSLAVADMTDDFKMLLFDAANERYVERVA